MERTIKSWSVFVDISTLILSCCFFFNYDKSLYALRSADILIKDLKSTEVWNENRFVVKLWRHPFGLKSGSDDGETYSNAPWWKEVNVTVFNYYLRVMSFFKINISILIYTSYM